MIGFLYPWALAGLVAAAVPLLLHFRAQRQPPTVEFPAVRYLQDAARRHERRLLLRHWLLLAVRTLLVVALVLAAAGPTAPLRDVGPHAPMALVLVVDNSLSSGVTVGGTERLGVLRAAARQVVARASGSDRLWLVTTDGVPRAGDAMRIAGLIDSLRPLDRRLDLGDAVTAAASVLDAQTLPGGIVVLSDLQRTALSPVATRLPILVGAASVPVATNRGVSSVDAGPQPWGLEGGRVTVSMAGDSGAPVQLALSLGDRPVNSALGGVGRPATVAVSGVRPGWYRLAARVDADELRGDDERAVAVRVAPAAAVAWSEGDRYLAAALAALESSGRVTRGDRVRFGELGGGPSIVVPPADPAAVGAVNRALAARGVSWRFADLRLDPTSTDSSSWLRPVQVTRRYRLRSTGSGLTGVVVTAGGEPWVVRSGDVVLIGSRFEPGWTALPLTAGFVPFVDALANRIVRGDVASTDASVGEPSRLPDQVTEVVSGSSRWSVEGGASFTPPARGIYWLLGGRDTVGALAANIDPRESDLRPATGSEVRSLWPSARVVPAGAAAAEAFGLSARADLRGPLLWFAALLLLVDLALAAAGGRASRSVPRS